MAELATKNLQQIVADQAVTAQAQAPGRDLDFTEGSVLRALAEGFGSIGMWQQGLVLRVLAATRAITSEGSDLDTWVADYDLTRSPARPARGEARFSRFTPGLPALIPIGATIKTIDGAWTYRVVAQGGTGPDPVLLGYVVPQGQTSLTVPVEAVQPGAGGNAAPNTVTLLSTAIPGIDTVTNLAAIAGGTEPETDQSLRARFRAYNASLSRAVRPAIDYAVGQVQGGLTWSVLEQQRPDGTVAPSFFTLVVDDGSGAPSNDLIARVAAAVEAYRALGVAYAVVGPVVLTANVTMTLTTVAGASHPEVVGAVATALTRYINALPLGSGLSYTRLAQVAYAADARVENVTAVLLNNGSVDVPAAPRRAVRAGTVAVS